MVRCSSKVTDSDLSCAPDRFVMWQDPIPGLWRMTLVAVTALFSYLVTNGYYQVGLVGSVLAALLFGVCQVREGPGTTADCWLGVTV